VKVRALALLAALPLLAGCGGGSLVGVGSSFVYPLAAKWIPEYEQKHCVSITYGPIGSGGGVTQMTNRTVDFGASDAPLTPDQRRACKSCLQIPWALAATSIPYNVPGASPHLKLSRPAVRGGAPVRAAASGDPVRGSQDDRQDYEGVRDATVRRPSIS
jgi:ABC-type phosphate transport system substrate-binding protein